MENLIPVPPKKKDFWSGSFDKIETKEDALKVIKEFSHGLYFLAIIHIAAYFILAVRLAVLLDGIMYVVLAFLLHKFNSKIVAIILLLIGIVNLIVFVVVKVYNYDNVEGPHPVLVFIIIYFSIRAVQATFRLQKLQ
ncbi:MAG: hypothetical protein Q8N37_02845 [bacterium]|nr:hypothetical protein [bacterium]